MGWLLNLARDRRSRAIGSVGRCSARPNNDLARAGGRADRIPAAYFLHKSGANSDLTALTHAARWLNRLANELSALGRREEALTGGRRGSGPHRRWLRDTARHVQLDPALSLANLAPILSALGRHEEAVTSRRRRFAFFARSPRRTPRIRDHIWPGHWPISAPWLSDLGRREEALTAGEEAVGVYHVALANHPDEFTPSLTASLGNLSRGLPAIWGNSRRR